MTHVSTPTLVDVAGATIIIVKVARHRNLVLSFLYANICEMLHGAA